MVILRCSDGIDLEVEEAVAMKSMTIRRRMEADRNGIVELPDISSAALGKVMEYCSKHAAAASSSSGPSALKDWDTVFINSTDDATLSQIVSVCPTLSYIPTFIECPLCCIDLRSNDNLLPEVVGAFFLV